MSAVLTHQTDAYCRNMREMLREINRDANPRPTHIPERARPWLAEARWLRDEIDAYRNAGAFPEECLLWPHRRTSYGVGYLLEPYWRLNRRGNWWFDCRHHPAHHVAWQFVYGRIPDGVAPDHTCFVRDCWNPTHLVLKETIKTGHPKPLYHL